jgi:Fic family protein
MYIWQLPDWPAFRWNMNMLAEPLAIAHRKEGQLLGAMARLGFDVKLAAEVEAMTEEALKSSEIEGEALDRASVRSSVARQLGVADAALAAEDRKVDGIVTVTLDATKNHAAKLTKKRLAGWHAALFPTGFSGMNTIKAGTWRNDANGPMQVVSGPIGRPTIHFEAPPASRIDAEMAAFLNWFEKPRAIDGILHAAVAHLWFVTIHPFEDGNGRIARALADMSLARWEDTPQRFYSLSGAIRRERPQYYATLERAQKGDLDITERLLWFVGCFSAAVDAAQETCEAVLLKAAFWQRHALAPFTERQRKVLNRLLDGFEGKLTAPKWAALTKTSIPTAQRDIKELVEAGVLIRNPGGSKNTSYSVAIRTANIK